MTEEQIKQKAQENAGSVSNFDLNITLMVAENKIDAYRLGRNDGFIDGYHECEKEHEWHYMKDVTCWEDLPQEEDSKNKLFMWKVKIHNERGSVEFNGWHSGNYGDLIYEINAYQVYCYKEIVIPKEIE